MATGQSVDEPEPEPMDVDSFDSDKPDDMSQVRKLTPNQNKRKLLQGHWC